MARSAGRATLRWLAASPMALMKQADQPAANSCSGLVPPPVPPGADSLTSRRPSELREAPSRPPVVWAWAVYKTFSMCDMTCSFKGCDDPAARRHWPTVRGRFDQHLQGDTGDGD